MQPLDEATVDNLLSWYAGLEQQLVAFLGIVPPHGANLGAWSPALATVIVEACGLIDSLYRHVSVDSDEGAGTEPKRQRDLELPDYFDLFGNPRALPARKVIALLAPPTYRRPFAGWTRVLAPGWWSTHNRLKHQRLDHLPEATTETAIDALGGALLAISTTPELARGLVGRGWLDTGRWSTGAAYEFLEGGCVHPLANFLVDTGLFAIALGTRPLPDDIREFHVMGYEASPKLAARFPRL